MINVAHGARRDRVVAGHQRECGAVARVPNPRWLRTLTVQAHGKRAQLENKLVLDLPVQLYSQSTRERVAPRRLPVPVSVMEQEAESLTQKELPTFICLVWF